MQTFIVAVVLMTVASIATAAPGAVLLTTFAAPSSDVKIVRDGLGNQATSYAYQDGHSSAVALTRTDVDSHLVAAPVVYHTPQVVTYNTPAVYQQAVAPAVYHHAAAPAYYNHGAPAYYV